MASERDPHPPTTPSGETVRLDARSIRGLAHPLRLKILGLLRTEGPATATRLAARLSLNSGATSYHLRQLAAYGFIVEEARRGTDRERWWRAAHASTYFDREALSSDETGEAFLRSVGQIYAERIQRAADERSTLPPAWQEASWFSDWVLLLTPAETRQLTGELMEVIQRYRRHDPESPAPAPPDSLPVSLQVQAIPNVPVGAEISDGPAEHAEGSP